METLFLKVRNEDIQTLTTVLQPVKKMALDSISNFLELHSKSVESLLINEESLSEEQNLISKGKWFTYFVIQSKWDISREISRGFKVGMLYWLK